MFVSKKAKIISKLTVLIYALVFFNISCIYGVKSQSSYIYVNNYQKNNVQGNA